MDTAEIGATLVRVLYEALPAVLTPEEALAEGAPKVHEEGNVLCTYKTSKGNVEEGFKEAAYIFEREYATQREDHVPIEPEAVIARPTPEGMTIYAPTNSVYNVRQTISQTLGVDEHNVRFITPTIGVSFGAKNYDLAVMASRAAVAAGIIKRPCKIVYTREASIMEGTKRHPYKIHYKVGMNGDGRISQCLQGVEKKFPGKQEKKSITHLNQNNKYKKRGLGLAIMHRGEAFGGLQVKVLTPLLFNLHTN